MNLKSISDKFGCMNFRAISDNFGEVNIISEKL